MITWRYVKPLTNANAIIECETRFGIIFDKNFIECVRNNNGGRPSANTFDTAKTKERTIKSLLSFNEHDVENVLKNNEVLTKENSTVVAFAIDSFGNYICFSKENRAVVFFDFETGDIEHVAENFSQFVSMLR